MESRIRSEWEEVIKSFPKLEDIQKENDLWKSKGEIDIIDSSGILWWTFLVRIIIQQDYPKVLPKIFETNGDLPRNSDWHINPDGSCCVGPSCKIYRKLEYQITIKRWLMMVVVPYLFDQVYRLEKGTYKGKEHAHGKEGLLNDYKEWWNLKSNEEVIEMLKIITKRTRILRNAPCYCGSKLKYKKCHLFAQTYKDIPLEVYENDLSSILTNASYEGYQF